MAKRRSRVRRPKQLEPEERIAEPQFDQFLGLSAALTGFSRAELEGTGMQQTYYAFLPQIAGEAVFGEILTRWRDLSSGTDPRYYDELIREEILDDDFMGPVAKNLTFLWYTGQWNQLPWAWRNTHGANMQDNTHIVSPQSYVEGLVWKAMHTHPPAAKPPGFASWALKPKGT